MCIINIYVYYFVKRLDLVNHGYASILKWRYRVDYRTHRRASATRDTKCWSRSWFGSILWHEYRGSRIKVQLLRIFQSDVTICRSDKIALFLVINLLNLECIAKRVRNPFSFLTAGFTFCSVLFWRALISKQQQHRIGANRNKRRLAELTETISFCAIVKYRKLQGKWK